MERKWQLQGFQLSVAKLACNWSQNCIPISQICQVSFPSVWATAAIQLKNLHSHKYFTYSDNPILTHKLTDKQKRRENLGVAKRSSPKYFGYDDCLLLLLLLLFKSRQRWKWHASKKNLLYICTIPLWFWSFSLNSLMSRRAAWTLREGSL
jgi:hypothetical protein